MSVPGEAEATTVSAAALRARARRGHGVLVHLALVVVEPLVIHARLEDALVLVATRRAGRRSGIPFGPWMVCGAWVGVLFGADLWNAYLALLGIG